MTLLLVNVPPDPGQGARARWHPGEWGDERHHQGAAPENDSSLVAPERWPQVLSLRELMERPELLEVPPALIAGMVYRGRATLLAGREKLGKTTFVAAAVAALARGGTFLGVQRQATRTLWLTEEHMGEPVQRFLRFDAAPDMIDVVRVPHEGTPVERVAWLAEIVATGSYGLVVIDTLAAFTTGVRSRGDSAEMSQVMTPLVDVAHQRDVGLILNAHARKSDGKYAESYELGARVDVIAEMSEGSLAHQRKIDVRGRFGTTSVTVSFTGTTYDIASRTELSLDVQVLETIVANPGCNQRAIELAVPGRGQVVRDAIRALLAAGRVVNRGDARSHAYYPAAYAPDAPGRATGRADARVAAVSGREGT